MSNNSVSKADLVLSPSERATVIITETALSIESYSIWSHSLEKWVDVDLDKLFMNARHKWDQLYLDIEKKLQGAY